MPKVTIDDVSVEVPAGTNMIEAAKQAGVEIPHYCYHPHLSIAGNCRMCLVDVVGGRAPEIACNMAAREGLAIRTDTPNVAQMRRSVMEFLLANHPLDCPICDQSGECKLQDYYMDHGRYDSRLVDEKVEKQKRQDIGDLLVLDAERCVECSRCVRFGDEVTGTGDLRLFNRGDHTEIGVFPGERITHGYQGCLADVCPVGALTNKEFRFDRRAWYLRETDGVCTGCATGCNTKVCHQDGQVFRYLPRRNDAVNKSWMCDTGRQSYTDVTGMGRILHARVGGEKKGVDEAVGALANAIKGTPAAKIGVVLGARATNEANWALSELVRRHLPAARVFRVEGNDAGSVEGADRILVDADKNPNTYGARLVAGRHGSAGEGGDLAAAMAELKLLLVLEDDILTRLGDVAWPSIAYLGCRACPTATRAGLVIPTTHAVEMDGTYVNRDGRVQRTRRALNPLGDSRPAYAVIDQLGGTLGARLGTSTATAAFERMAKDVPRMAGMTYKTLGKQGQPLGAEPDAAAAVQPGAP